jgi:hypothetical protein
VKFQKKPGLTPRDVQILVLIGLSVLIVLSVLTGANIGLSRLVPGGGGFFVAWQGARAFLFQRTEPYSGTVATLAQGLAYGRFAKPGENPYVLGLPFFLLPVYFPLALLSDPALARGLWLSISQAAVLAAAFLSLRLIEWQPRRFFLFLYALLSVFNFYSIVSLLEGAPSVLLGLLFVGVLLALQRGQDELAGALLVFGLFQWAVSFLFLLLVFWRVFSEKRWRVLAGFGMSLSVLLVISFLAYPGWVIPFLAASLLVVRSGFGIAPAAVFMHIFPVYGDRIAQGITILVILVLGVEWATTRDSDFRRFVWTACLTLAAAPLVGFRTEMSNLVVAFPSLALIFAAISDRWRYWATMLLWLIAFVVPWSLFARGTLFRDQFSQDLLFLFFPFFLLIGLYWTRWWFMRPPRTWLDRVAMQKSQTK